MHTTFLIRRRQRHQTASAWLRAVPAAAGFALCLSLAPVGAQGRTAGQPPTPQAESRNAEAHRAEAQRGAGQIAERAAAQFEAQKPPPWSQAERAFMQEALAASRFGTEAGRIGLHMATGPAVKNLAQKLAANHGALARRLEELAQSRGLALDATPSAAQRTALERLRTAGGSFDTTFVRTVGVQAQQDAVRLFEQARARSKDAQLRTWIDTQLVALRDQLSEAQRIPLRHAADRVPNSSDNHPTPATRP